VPNPETFDVLDQASIALSEFAHAHGIATMTITHGLSDTAENPASWVIIVTERALADRIAQVVKAYEEE
jgi:hypothetical protein